MVGEGTMEYMKRLIILRGNSGSGKTTVARILQEKLGRTTMLLSQDTLRREILRVKEASKHPTAELAKEMARFGWSHGFDTVIIEGIWGAKKNGWALTELIDESDVVFAYYFDVPFEETLRRHVTKPVAQSYGEKEMREWWKEKDILGVEDEQIIDETYTKGAIVEKVLHDIGIIEKN